MKNNILFLFCVATLMVASLSSCEDDSDPNIPPRPTPDNIQRHAVSVTHPGNTVVQIPQLSGVSIQRIENNSTWLKAEVGSVVDGISTVNISLAVWNDANHHGQGNKDSVLVVGSNGKGVNLVVNQARIGAADSGLPSAMATFLTDWENVTAVTCVDYNQDPIVVNLPWAASYSITFPDDMRLDMKKSNGWRMAFSMFADSTGQKFNYFGLYNLYTGLLRVYYYHPTNTSTGGELSFLVTPTSHTTPKYPFYHSWQYGIPVSHTDMHTKNNPFGVSPSDPGQTFQSITVPYYVGNEGSMLKIGWTVFEVDMTCYNPAWNVFAYGDGFNFSGQTQSTGTLSLYGTITASINGTFSYTPPPSPSVSSSSGLAGKITGTGIGGIFDNIAKGNYVSALFSGISAGINIAGAVESSKAANPQPQDGQGKMSLDLTGCINLGGYLTTATSNNIPNAGFTYDNKTDSTIGMGVWSLQTDPVVYVLNDMVIGAKNSPQYETIKGFEQFADTYFKKEYTIRNVNLKELQLRMVPFVDPTTIKINLATDNYPNIRDVNVSWCYGVYPNQPAGHTNSYRKLFGGLDVVGDGSAKTPDKGTWWQELNYPIENETPDGMMSKGYFPNYVKMTETELLSSIENGKSDEWRVSIIPAKSNGYDELYHYFRGKAYSGTAGSPDQFVVDPQVSLPFFRDSGLSIMDAVVPDFVVWVTVSFKYDDADGVEQIGIFSKRFLPDIKTISTADFKGSMKTKLNTYINNCVSGAAIQTINGTPVTHKGNEVMLEKVQKIWAKMP